MKSNVIAFDTSIMTPRCTTK